MYFGLAIFVTELVVIIAMKKLRSYFLPTRDILFIVIGGVILNALGLANNFPFVYPDSGSYIFHGASLEVPWGRPIIYSLFFKVATLRDTPYLAVLLQGIMLSYLCFLIFKYFCKHPSWRYLYLGAMFLMTVFTGLSFTVSRIMPDVFTPIMILGVAALMFIRELKIVNIILIVSILILSLAVHNSHVLILVGLLILYTLNILYRRWQGSSALIPLNRLFALWGISATSVLLVCSIHYQLGGGFTLTRGSHVFLMRQLIDYGIVEKYLGRECWENTQGYKLCEYKDKLNGNFIWDYKNSPFRILGGWEENEEEYKDIIFETLTDPTYFKMFLGGAIENTFKQFFSFHLDDFDPEKQGSAPYSAVDMHYHSQIHEYSASYQTKDRLDPLIHTYNARQDRLIYLSLFFMIACFFSKSIWKKLPLEQRWLIVFLFLALWANAFVCSSLSAVVTRYQYRVAWLLPLMVILVMSNQNIWTILKEKIWRS